MKITWSGDVIQRNNGNKPSYEIICDLSRGEMRFIEHS
jgi:hypothetical protein